MWANVRQFFSNKSYETAHVNKLEQDLSEVQQRQIDIDLAN